MSCKDTTPPVLLVFGDSLTYYGPQGALPANDPRIWPNLVATQAGWTLELVARIGWTTRDVWWSLTQDPRIWAVLPRVAVVIVAVSGMDSMPSILPTVWRESIRYVRPPRLRRQVRAGYGWIQRHYSRWARPALPPKLTIEYLTRISEAFHLTCPQAHFIASLPGSHYSSSYGYVHPGHHRTAQQIQQWAKHKQIPLIDPCRVSMAALRAGQANPDGIHWNFDMHRHMANHVREVLIAAQAYPGHSPS